MKKFIFFLLTLFFINPFFGQQSDNWYEIDIELVKSKTEEKLRTLLSQYKFPKDSDKYLEEHIYKFELGKQVMKVKYSDEVSVLKIDSLKNEFEQWRTTQKEIIKQKQNFWFKTKSRFELEDDFQEVFLAYHFYIAIDNPADLIVSRISELSKFNSLDVMIKRMSKHETDRIVKLSTALGKLDTLSVIYGAETLYDHLRENLMEDLSESLPLELIKDTNSYKTIVINAANEKQIENNAKILVQRNKAFVSRALEIGLTTDIANTLLGLIEKRKNDLEALKNSQNNQDDMSNLFDNTNPLTKSEIKEEFAQSLANLITRSQFSKLFGGEFSENVNTKSQEKLTSLKSLYELSEEQATKLTEMLNKFYFNEQVILAYYSFDKKLKKQKISALRFRFESDYKSLMDSFGQSVKPVKKMDQRTFKWD